MSDPETPVNDNDTADSTPTDSASTSDIVPETPAPPPRKPMLKVHLNNSDLTSANAQFTWCLTKDASRQLREQGVLRPFLLVVVAERNDWSGLGYEEIERQVYPLEQGLGLIQFPRAGTYTVFSTVIWADDPNPKTNRATSMKKIDKLLAGSRNGHYSPNITSVIDNALDWERLSASYEVQMLRDAEQFDITIDWSLFAEKPKGWVWSWVNFWFEHDAKNACSFRRRAMLAFTLQPIPVLLYTILKVLARVGIVFIMVMYGVRWSAMNFSPLIHPYTMTFNDIETDWKGDTYLWTHYDSDGKERPRFLQQILPPWRIGLFALLTSLLIKLVPHILQAALIIAVVIGVLSALIMGYNWLEEQYETRYRAKLDAAAKQRLEAFYASRVDALICENEEGTTPTPALAHAPRRTMHVRYLELKTKLCLPFGT